MRTLLILAVICILAQLAPASMPETVGYQGVLRDVSGNPVPDGVYQVRFSLWDADTGGTEYWFDTLDVSTEGGLFAVVLGKTSSFYGIPFDRAFWLGIEIAGEPELVPRIELTGSPYALRAKYSGLEFPYYGTASDPATAFTIENGEGGAITGRSFMGPGPGSAAVKGENLSGTILGGFAYIDGNLDPWGLYTNHNAYVAGTLTLPDGATDGYVLTSDADGDASWGPPSDFALPFSDTLHSIHPAFYIEGDGPAIVGRGGNFANGGFAGVRGEYKDGAEWGALGYFDENQVAWGVYTHHRAYFGDDAYIGGEAHLEGGVQLPTGAVNGHVLTSDGSGVGTWQAPPAGFTLPYSGAVWADGPVFELENTGLSEVARFIGASAGNQVEIGMGDWTGNALRLSGSATYAKIGGGTTTGRNDIVIEAVTGDIGIGALPPVTPDAKLYVDGRLRAEDAILSSGAADGRVLTSDADGLASWSQVGPAGLSDPMDFGSQTWDWDFTNGHVDIDATAASPILDITNSSTDAGGVALLRSTSTSASSGGTIVLWVTSQKGRAGTFKKYVADGYSAVDILADSPTGNGLYVSGTIASTSYSARGVETSRGTEPVFAAETVEPEIYDSGEAFLNGGRATVSFDRLFTEAVSKDARVRVTVTPIAGWSALYVDSTGSEGFSVRSADGDPNIEFFWTACALSKDHEVGSRITFPDSE